MTLWVLCGLRCCALWFVLLTALTVDAQDLPTRSDGEPPRVATVELRGADGLDTQRVISLLGVQPGDPFGHAALTAGLRRLLREPEIASARLSRLESREDGRVALEITLSVLPRLDGIDFVGNEAVSGDVLVEALGYLPGDLLTELDLEIAHERLLAKYHEDGFLSASVKLELRPLDSAPNNVLLVGRIVEGTRVTIGAIEFEGNEALSDRRLRATIQNRPRILFGVISKGYYRPQVFDADLELIRTLYRFRGYLDVIVQRGDLVVTRDTRELQIKVLIEEGRRYRVGRILIEGHNEVLESPLRERIRLESGEFYDAGKVERDLLELADYYHSQLFRSPWIEVKHRYDLDREDEVDVVFNINERRHYFAGRIAIEGNTHTRDRVLRNRLEFEPLGPVTQPLLLESAESLRSLEYFETAEVATTASRESRVVAAESGGEVLIGDVEDVTVKVEDTSEGLFYMSGGAESGRGAIAALGISKPNFDIFDWPGGKRGWKRPFTGGGQYFRAEIIPGTRNSQFNLFFREPHFLNSSHALSFSAFSDIFQWRDFDEIHIGSDLGVRTYWNRARHLSSRVSWVLEDIHIDNLDSDTHPFFQTFRGHTFYSYPSLRLNYNSAKVNRFSGPRGVRSESRIDLALDETGSETEFVRNRTSLDFYLDVNPWLNRLFDDEPLSTDVPSMAHILHFGGRFGWMEGISGDTVPFFEKFFLGGPRSFRGFEYRGVGPRIDDIPIGDETFWRGTVDYSFPVMIPEIRLQGIFEFGDIQRRISDYSSNSVRTAAGAGLLLRLQILEQVIPVNLYFLEALEKEREDRDRVFTFMLGYDF
jgi:outer membrane protein insertion porin family